MEPDRRYDLQEIRGLCPDRGIEDLREIMHELWIDRQVERLGYSAWRRHRSASPHASRPAKPDAGAVKPEDLFDHATFAEFFD